MKIPVGLTYIAHGFIALVALAGGVISLWASLGGLDSGSVEAYGMLVALYGGIPAGVCMLIAAYSAIAAIVVLVRRQPVPRDMLLLPMGFLVGIFGGLGLAESNVTFWKVVGHALFAGYLVLTLTLVIRYQLARRRADA